MGAPKGSTNRRGSQDKIAAVAPTLGPKARAAMRHAMPEGSYMSHGAAGNIGICTKLSMSEAAVNSAVNATRFVSIELYMGFLPFLPSGL